MPQPLHLFVTGSPGCGKSTLIHRVLQQLGDGFVRSKAQGEGGQLSPPAAGLRTGHHLTQPLIKADCLFKAGRLLDGGGSSGWRAGRL